MTIRPYEPNRDFPSVLHVYESVGWAAYTDQPATLREALFASHQALVFEREGVVVGFARTISDGKTICYLQDLLVHPNHQRTGVGRSLLQHVLDSYQHVRQLVLMTDNRPEQFAFYTALGFREIRDNLRGFVRLAD